MLCEILRKLLVDVLLVAADLSRIYKSLSVRMGGQAERPEYSPASTGLKRGADSAHAMITAQGVALGALSDPCGFLLQSSACAS